MTRLIQHIRLKPLKTLKPFAIRIAAHIALAAGAAIIISLVPAGLEAAGAPASRPGSAAGPGESLVFEILGAGLEGYFNDYEPARIHYRIHNPGPPRKITLGLEQLIEGKASVPVTLIKNHGGFSRQFDMPAGAVLEGRLIVPNPRDFFIPKTRNMLTARDLDGQTVARADLPDLKSGSPVLILVREPRDAAHIQTALLLYAPRRRSSGGSAAPNVAVLAGRAPGIWHEYTPAKTVILARKWAGLESAQRKALTRWISGGGILVVAPGRCPDWRSAPWGGLSKTWGRYGMGEINIIPAGLERGAKEGIDEKSLGDWFDTRGLLPRDYERSAQYYGADDLQLTHNYAMPGTWLLALFIFVIVLLIGPVTHLVLARAGRREWAWAIVPGLSLLLALGAYGTASRAKGGTVLEIRHLVRMFEGLPEATVTTSTRVLSSRKQEVSVRLSADDPNYRYSQYSRNEIVAEAIRLDGIDLVDIPMQRFSFKDLRFTSFVGNPPAVEIRPVGKGAVVENTSAGELRDVFFHTGSGWLPVAPVLRQGQQAVVGPLTKAVGASELKPDWQVEGGGERLARTLGPAVMSRRSAFSVVARCDSSGFTSLTIKPAPDQVFQDTVCVWLKREREGAAP
ncbi:MAG: hypothetical protein KKH28_00245 [Elusimicrobia bacterium]|nr:hypothetical protein [Elusimicrobiota bacterium]